MGLIAQGDQRSQRLLILAALLITCLGAAWRVGNLGHDSYWLDEMTTVRRAHAGLDAMYDALDHPPLLHAITYLVVNSLGGSELEVRLPMAVAGILAIPLMVLLGVVIKRPGAGLWAALLLALLPFHLRYSQEARYYAFLMTFSLVTYILLIQALTRPHIGLWTAFGAATALNLYTHYGALLVLAWEGILVCVWAIQHLRQREFRMLVFPVVAGMVAGLLYLPWLPRMLLAFDLNTGPDALGGLSDVVPSAQVWIAQAYPAFGFGSGILPLLVAALCLAGLVACAWERDWIPFSSILLGLIVPLVLIQVFAVARWAWPKYIIYLLPLYLISAGITLSSLFRFLRQRLPIQPPFVRTAIPTVVALALVGVTWPLLRQEHTYVEEDWKGITQHLASVAQDGDVFLSMALDLPNGFNQGAIVWPYYLDQTFGNYVFLASNELQAMDVQGLADMDADVWLVLLNRNSPTEFQPGTADVSAFQNSLYLVHPTVQPSSSLGTMIAMYQQMILMATAPSPRCMLQHDLAAMYVVTEDYVSAEQMVTEASSACPEGSFPGVNHYLLMSQIYQGLLEQYQQQGQTAGLGPVEEKARNAAAELLRLGFQDPAAVKLLTVQDLLQTFASGEAEVSDSSAPEPVQVRRYTMPQNGDWSDVLFIHAGASVSFHVVLPEEPTSLYFRAAMDPDSWDWGGDGATFVVRIETDSGESTELFREHVSNGVSDRRWHDALVPLAEYAGQTVTLTLATEPGPTGDYTGDWAGWGMPLVILGSK
jgi:4-amino-4-deoxy-L-arabinose transferase-like glycosyltransferase